MTQFDKEKFEAAKKLLALCRHCSAGQIHDCPVSRVVEQIRQIRGVPIIVNDRLHHVMFS